MLVFGALQVVKHVFSGQGVNSVFRVLRFAMKLSAHGVRLSGSGLSICKARGHATLEDVLHQGPCRVLVNEVVVSRVLENIVKPEVKV